MRTFDIRTGQNWCDPARVRSRRYAVSVQPGTKLITGPYVAETVPVTVENAYVVVSAEAGPIPREEGQRSILAALPSFLWLGAREGVC